MSKKTVVRVDLADGAPFVPAAAFAELIGVSRSSLVESRMGKKHAESLKEVEIYVKQGENFAPLGKAELFEVPRMDD